MAPKGKFRGAPFFVVAYDRIVGRRQPTHALPFQEKGAISVDLGRAPQKLAFTAVLIGDDVLDQQKALMAAFEGAGPGILEHPEIGRLSVTIDPGSARFTLRTSALRRVDVTFRCTEAYDQPPQVSSLDTGAALKRATFAGRIATAASFANEATGLRTDVSDFVRSANLDVLDTVINDLNAINGSISSVLSIPSGFAAQIDAISRNLALLIATPDRLFSAIDGMLESLAASAARVLDANGNEVDAEDVPSLSSPTRRGVTLKRAITPASTIGDDGRTVPAIDTQDRRDQLASKLAIQRHIRASALLNLAATAADIPYDSAADAREVRDLIANALADLADSEPDLDAPMQAALKNAASSAQTHLSTVAGLLPDIVEHTPSHTVSTFRVAWDLYADTERAEEVLLRNPTIRHPLFATGGRALEVSTR